ncbi:MAG: polymer-forming cytoskeletal protein [Leptonema sp. (in: bacteria)]
MPINLQKTIIGPKVKIEGNITLDEELIIEGKVIANRIDAGNHPIIVGLQAEVQGDLYAREIIIYGKLKGNSYAKKSIYLGDKAIVEGDCNAPLIDIEPTSIIRGRLYKK